MGTPTFAASLSAAAQMKEHVDASGRAMVPRPGRTHRPMRKFQITHLGKDGHPHVSEQIAPAMPLFDMAFSAFSHGTLISTSNGQIAVQDLSPGMKLSTADHGPMRLLWVGSMTLVPTTLSDEDNNCRLTRIMPDAFGLGRPEANLMAGPGARLLTRPSGLRDSFGRERVLTPARDLVDGSNVIEVIPPRPVTVYHLALRRHVILKAGGLEVESYHPGPGFERHLGPNMLSLFLSMFRHIQKPSDFGATAYPRLPLDGMQTA